MKDGESTAQERAETPVSVLSELADTGVDLKSLVASFPVYAHRSAQILKSPFVSFRASQVPTRTEFRQSLAFLLQGLILSFVVVTMGRALPQSIATFSAVNVPLMSGSRADLIQYGQRVEAISGTLPPELTRSWLRQGELMLVVRVLSDERFNLLLERLRQLSGEKPQVLQLAIDGSLAGAERFGGRNYLLSFFTALNPQVGPLFYQTYQIAYAGPNYQLQPHVEFLLSSLLLWFLACAVAARFMPRLPGDPRKHTVFAMGALLWGVLNPLYQSFNTLLRFYLAATLPAYIPLASQMLSSPSAGLAEVSGGVFPYENLALVAVRVVTSLALLGLGIGALSVGLRSVFRVSKTKAIATSAAGVFLGLGITEGAMRILAAILAPTGLL